MRNQYLDDLIDGAHPATEQSCVANQNANSARYERLVVRVIVGGPTMARDSNRSRKNYSRYAMISNGVFFNTPTSKQAKTRQVLIIWTDEDEEGVLYPHEDSLVIKATVASKKFDRIPIDTGI